MGEYLVENGGTLLLEAMFAVLLFAAIIEALIPRRPETGELAGRWFTNLSLAAVSTLVSQLFTRLTLIVAAMWAQAKGIGLLSLLDLGMLPTLAITLVVMEFANYVLHRLFHSVPWMWRCHAIHHTDIEVDFTTTYRHHPFETIIMSLVGIPLVLLLGLDTLALVVYQLLSIITGVLTHTNLYIPERIEKILRVFVITPDFHRLHHSSTRLHTDSNYGALVPWFDRLFGTETRRPFADHIHMELGLEYMRELPGSRLDHLLLLPFRWSKYARPENSNTSATGMMPVAESH